MMSIENLVIKRMLYSSVFRLLSIINQRIRKDKKIILFYCNSTGGFRDNLKAVYDYLLENDLQHHYRIIRDCR
jgi:CDP-glycerol glycerophosphotransferase (TagB/SpsB family)